VLHTATLMHWQALRNLLLFKYVSVLFLNSFIVVRFEVFTAVTMKKGVFWVVTPCGSAAYVGC
jgi:hypothetical protein